MKAKLDGTDTLLADTKTRLTKTEGDCASLVSIKTQVQELERVAEENAKQTSFIVPYLQDRPHRPSLLFFGLVDCAGETWAQSKEKVISDCSAELNINIQPRDIELAHRLGTLDREKKIPIIVKFAYCKDNDQIHSASRKFKE